MFVKGGQFCKVANFLMSITHHGILEDQSEAYILTCTKKDNTDFTVPVNLSYLDSFAKLYNKFLKYRPADTTILQDIGRRGKVHRHIDTLIKKYMNCEEKNEVFLVERYGFYHSAQDFPPIFVVGKELAIFASQDAGNQVQKQIMWIGPKTAKNCKVGPLLKLEQTAKILQQLKGYHGPNFASVLLLLSFTKVSVHRLQLLEQCGICLFVLFVLYFSGFKYKVIFTYKFMFFSTGQRNHAGRYHVRPGRVLRSYLFL